MLFYTCCLCTQQKWQLLNTNPPPSSLVLFELFSWSCAILDWSKHCSLGRKENKLKLKCSETDMQKRKKLKGNEGKKVTKKVAKKVKIKAETDNYRFSSTFLALNFFFIFIPFFSLNANKLSCAETIRRLMASLSPLHIPKSTRQKPFKKKK